MAYVYGLMLQAFSGTQNVSSQQKEEAWRVNVQIQGIDLEHGYLCGTMEALNVPMADTPVIPCTLYLFVVVMLLPFGMQLRETILDCLLCVSGHNILGRGNC